MKKAFLTFAGAMIAFAVLHFLLRGDNNEEDQLLEEIRNLARSNEIKEVMFEDMRGPDNLERRSSTRDSVWMEPTHKRSLFRGIRYGTM